MRREPIIFLLLPLMAMACATRTEVRTVKPDYDTEIDCLNGTMIVSLDGKYGLADTSGREILVPTYDDIYYISDEIAVAFTGLNVEFFDRGGRRLGETMVEGEADVEDLLVAYSRIENARRRQWDDILDSYDELRKYCRSDSASAQMAKLMADKIRASLQTVGGPMEKDQKVRFENE